MTGAPTQAEPLPSSVRPTRFTAAVGCAWDIRSPVELPRYRVCTSSSANPASTASRARALPNAPDSAASTGSSTPESVCSGSRPKSRPGAVPEGATSGNASSLGGACRASASAARTISDTPSVPTTPVRLAVPAAEPATTITLTDRPRCTPLVVVVFTANRTSAWLPSSTSATQPSAPAASASASARSTSSWAAINRRPPPIVSLWPPRGR